MNFVSEKNLDVVLKLADRFQVKFLLTAIQQFLIAKVEKKRPFFKNIHAKNEQSTDCFGN